jgi:hypothetical protein
MQLYLLEIKYDDVMSQTRRMADKDDAKVDLTVVVKTKSSTGIIVVIVIIILLGTITVMMSEGGVEGLLGGSEENEGNCDDGIDNDGGGQADRDDPDCYNNPEVWQGYDENRSEVNRDNDLAGRP